MIQNHVINLEYLLLLIHVCRQVFSLISKCVNFDNNIFPYHHNNGSIQLSIFKEFYLLEHLCNVPGIKPMKPTKRAVLIVIH